MIDGARAAAVLFVLLLAPALARADELAAADLEAIDRVLSSPTPAVCSDAREHLRLLREAYGRQSSPVVQSAIAARVPMALDMLRFCIETSPGAPDPIEPARRMLAAAREHPGCELSIGSMEELIAAWESESSEVVRSALRARLESISQTVRFCVETTAAPTTSTPPAPATTSSAPRRPGRALGSPRPAPR